MKRIKSFFVLLFLFIITSSSFAQIKVSGIVIDESGDPIIGANVVIKGTTQGIATDIDGKFTINAKEGQKLVISFVGMKDTEVVAKESLKITLLQDVQKLDEVVVTALGISRKKQSIGYASQDISAKELTKTKITDVNNALVGKVSGVRFVGGSGATFDEGSIFLRGSSSITNSKGSEPIYVIDGVITNKAAVNMDNVANINILKGPAATSLYGSRGGNGAIIITSKKPEEGKSQIDFSHTFGWETIYPHFNIQKQYGGGYGGAESKLPSFELNPNTPEYLKQFAGRKIYDYNNDASWGPKFNGEEYMPWYAWDPTDPRFGKQTKWKYKLDIGDLYRTGISNTTNIAFSKSGKDYSTSISFKNVDRKGVSYNSEAIRRYANINSSFNPIDNFKISFDYKFTYRKTKNAAEEGYGEFKSFLAEYLQWGNTNVDLKDLKKNYKRPDGTFRTWNINSPYDLRQAYHENPFAIMNEVNEEYYTQWHIYGLNAEYSILKNLKIGLNVFGNVRNDIIESKTPQNFSQTSSYSQAQYQLTDLQYQGYISYNNSFLNDRLGLEGSLYIEKRDFERKNVAAFTRDGIFLDKFWNVDASNGLPGGSSELLQNKSQSIFATATLSIDQTYYLDANIRNDWTSTLIEKNNSYLYGGLSASVVMSKLMKKDNFFWKLRSSFAQVGSSLDPYNIYPVYSVGTKYKNNTTMRFASNLRNPNIKPTISTSYEIGTEIKFFNNRLWADLNFYNKDANNQIINRNLTPGTGYLTETVNAGLIRNRGIEISIGGMPISTNDLSWTINFNYAKNNNTLEKFIQDDKSINSYQIWWTKFQAPVTINAVVGKSIGVIQGNDWKRDSKGNLILEKLDKEIGKGDVTPIVDNENTTKTLGYAQPKFNGGFSSSLNYKGFKFDFTLDFSVGGNIVSVSNLFGNSSGIFAQTVGLNDRNVPLRNSVSKGGGVHLKGVDSEGKPIEGYIDAQYYYQDLYSRVWAPSVYSASYVKLREVSFGYDISKKLLDDLKIGIKSASISFFAQNPWLIYSGVPGIDASDASGLSSGFYEGGQSIATRNFGLSINATF